MPTQNEYNVVKNRQRKLYAKFNILNSKMQAVDEISGEVIGDISFSNNSESEFRRTSSITIAPKDNSFQVEKGGKIWIDKYIKIYLGIESLDGEIVYTNMGIYLINNPNQIYSETENTISLQLIDLMAKLTGLRGGNLEGIEYQIPSGSDVRMTIIGALAEQGFTKYSIDKLDVEKFPNELKMSAGGTTYQLLKQIKEVLLSNYQMYFDVDGVFHFSKIPSGTNEQIMVNDDIWNSVLISYNIDINYDNVKNYIEVYGKTHNVSYYNNATWAILNTVLNVDLAELKTLHDGDEIGFTTPSGTYLVSNILLKINNGAEYPVRWGDGSSATLKPNVYYVVIYKKEGYFSFLGNVSPSAVSKDINPDSPFNINDIGLLRLVLGGGEYDNIPTDELAQQRADYELYLHCRLQDSLILVCAPVLWLDTNWLIEITLPNKFGKKVKEKYMIKSIDTTFGLSGVQSIKAIKYYPTA